MKKDIPLSQFKKEIKERLSKHDIDYYGFPEPYCASSEKEWRGLIFCACCKKSYEPFHAMNIIKIGHVCFLCVNEIVMTVLKEERE